MLMVVAIPVQLAMFILHDCVLLVLRISVSSIFLMITIIYDTQG